VVVLNGPDFVPQAVRVMPRERTVGWGDNGSMRVVAVQEGVVGSGRGSSSGRGSGRGSSRGSSGGRTHSSIDLLINGRVVEHLLFQLLDRARHDCHLGVQILDTPIEFRYVGTGYARG